MNTELPTCPTVTLINMSRYLRKHHEGWRSKSETVQGDKSFKKLSFLASEELEKTFSQKASQTTLS